MHRLSPAPFSRRRRFSLFFFNDTATTEIYTLSLHDALPICFHDPPGAERRGRRGLEHHRIATNQGRREFPGGNRRSEEHTSELQSRLHLVCRLLLEKKNTAATIIAGDAVIR